MGKMGGKLERLGSMQGYNLVNHHGSPWLCYLLDHEKFAKI